MKKIQLQYLYLHWLLVSAFDGGELHKLFQRLVGDPSPSGAGEVLVSALEADPVGSVVWQHMQTNFSGILPEIAENWGCGLISAADLLDFMRVVVGTSNIEVTSENVQPLLNKTLMEAMPDLVELLGINPGFSWKVPGE